MNNQMRVMLIQGVVYRMIGPPRNATNQQPACRQTYFFDLDEQVRLRTLQQPPNPGEAQLDSEVFRESSSSLLKNRVLLCCNQLRRRHYSTIRISFFITILEQ